MTTANAETFTITSADGIALNALIQRSAAPIGSILLAHGFSSDLHEEGAFDRLADALVEAGITALRFSFRGHGHSAGAQTEMTIAGERLDLTAAYTWMTANLPGPYGLLGASFGGVSTTLELDSLHPKPACFALWNPALEISHIFGMDVVETARREGSALVHSGYRVGLKFVEERAQYHGNLGLHHLGEIPALIVHGTEDVLVPLASSVAAANAPHVDLIVLHGAAHGFHDPHWETEAVRVTVDWVEHQLREDSDLPASSRIPHPMESVQETSKNPWGWTEYRPYRPVAFKNG